MYFVYALVFVWLSIDLRKIYVFGYDKDIACALEWNNLSPIFIDFNNVVSHEIVLTRAQDVGAR